MPPGNRLAPPSPNYLQNAGQFVGGVGRGLSNQFVTGPLSVVQQSWENPYALGQGIVMGAQQFAQDPVGSVKNSLREMWTRAKSSPAGLGEVVGENIDPRNWLKPRKVLRHELDVYHGTPHTFEPEEGAPLGRFRSSKIGTGEGAQAYGYGLYLAEHPDVAGQYRQIAGHQGPFNAFLIPDAAHPELQDLSHKASLSGNHAAAWVYDELLTGDFGPEQLLRKASKEELPAVQEALANAESVLKKHKGSLYKVDLPDAKIEQMLDWDKPISQQPLMQKAFDKFWKGLSKNERAQAVFDEFGDYDLAEQMAKNPGEVRGRLAYTLMTHHFGDQAAASDFLRQQGVPGIKYLDAGSRAGEKGTRNFVVFPGEEQHLNILSRD